MSARFMVIKFRELLKTTVFAILGAAAIIALLWFLIPKTGGEALYTPGTYSEEVALGNEKVSVEVVLGEKKIKDISLKNTSETLPVFYPMFEETLDSLAKEIVKKQSLDVDIPLNAEITSSLILEAVDKCLAKAEIK